MTENPAKSRPISAIELGATLYFPASRPDLDAALQRADQAGARSAVICLEDALRHDEVEAALVRLRGWLGARSPSANAPHIFIRPRSAIMLDRLLTFSGIEQVAGFVIPKATAACLPDYLAVLGHHPHQIMPTLETREAFDSDELRRLREQLLAVQDRVLALRIGGNDLLQLLGTRRSPVRTAYDGPLGPLIGQLVGAFRPWGFELSAPVCERFDNPALLHDEVLRDIDYGLLTKTAVHPDQVALIHAAYRVSRYDLDNARAMMDDGVSAVYSSGRVMQEVATHRVWAKTIIGRAALFGVADVIDQTQGDFTQ